MGKADGSNRALVPLRSASRKLRRAGREVRDFVLVPATRADRRVDHEAPPARRLSGRARWAIAFGVLFLFVAPIAVWISYQSGYVMSRNAMVRGQLAEIGTRIEGVVTRIEVEEGQRVKAGQVLARMDDSRIRAEAQQAQAELEGLQRELEVERSAIAHEERRLENQVAEAAAKLAAAQAEVEAAQSRADDASGFYEARRALLPTGAISGESVRDAQAKARTAAALARAAKAEYAAALSSSQRAQIDSSGVAIRKQRIGVLEAGVLRARARLAEAQADLDGTLIRAPAEGAVVRRIVQPGGSVEMGTPILSFWLGDDLWIEAWLDEDDIGEVRIGSRAWVTLQSIPGREFAGVVERIGLTTDFEMPASEVPQPRFARMRGAPVVGVGIRLDNPPKELLPGLSAVVGIRRLER